MSNEKEKLIEMLNENTLVIEYKRLEKIVHSDELLSRKVNKLKEIQQSLMTGETISRRKEYNSLLNELEEHPVLVNYLEVQKEINALLQQIIAVIEKEISF